ncbi:nucleotide sugar dehydrogenase [Paramagnetospirillum kuznetsovii]|nr:nucleotide sugar dehydrogenase [Paramagnetospirillum kuznetsovii]
MKANDNVGRLCLPVDSDLRAVMQVIEAGQERICFLVESDGRLVMTVTDGDVRRALLAGKILSDPARDIHSRHPVTVPHGRDQQDSIRLLSKRIAVVPVVDAAGRVTDILRFHDAAPLSNVKSLDVAIIGMGYVGLTLGVVMADSGFSVIGYDRNPDLIAALDRLESPFFERGLDLMIHAHVGHSLQVTANPDDLQADIYIVCVGTPIDKTTKKPDTSGLEASIRTVGTRLKKDDFVILRSTVPFGYTRERVIPLLEETSGLRCGDGFKIAFCPERTIEGKALEELRRLPQIVGGFDTQSRELALRLFYENTHTVIDVGSIEAAELCKLLDNTYRDTIFAFSNQMARFAEGVGLDLHDLIRKVNLGYSRNAIPLPSPGVGGSCLSKDPYILADAFERRGLDATLLKDARAENELWPAHIRDRCQALLRRLGKDMAEATVFIMGFAFKGEPETSDLRESTTLWLLDHLRSCGVANIRGYDPVVGATELAALGIETMPPEQGFAGADIVLLMNNHRSFTHLAVLDLLNRMNKPSVFFDAWHMFDRSEIERVPGITYAGVGS